MQVFVGRRSQLVWGTIGLTLTSLAMAAGAWAAPSSQAGLARGSVSGHVIGVNGGALTIQTPGRQIGVVNALANAATRITHQDYPYVYGGGHSQAGVASIGMRGPGYNGHRRGYDCSGSVAAVLVAAGLWPAGSGVPADNGIISQLRSEGLIVRGAGAGPVEVTLYDDPGVHIFMNIDGRFFGTSDGGGGGNPRGGAGWLSDGAPDATSSRYRRYHFKTSALRGSVSSGHDVTFELGNLDALSSQLQTGESVRVTYMERQSGLMVATALAPPHGAQLSGSVTAIASDGSTFEIQRSGGTTVTFATAQDPAVSQLIAIGDVVRVLYTRHGSTLNARLVMVTSGGGSPGGTGSGGWPGSDGSGGGSGGLPGGGDGHWRH